MDQPVFRPPSNHISDQFENQTQGDSQPVEKQSKDSPDTLLETLHMPPPTVQEDAEAPTPKMAHDSMVTVRLSESSILTLEISAASDSESNSRPDISCVQVHSDKSKPIPNSISINATQKDGKIDNQNSMATERETLRKNLPRVDTTRSSQDQFTQSEDSKNDSATSEDFEQVNWEELEKTEDEQAKDDETDNSTALLLARLEQENAKLATNPKTVKVQAVERLAASKSRPPSMAQLRQMMTSPAPPELRYSMLPPPPMTDLEFYTALVKDYQQTAARLPTLLSNKIRKGIPPPLRGVVWISMSGAREARLEDHFDRLCGEPSPYELLIGKDLGRSFPGVDMFRDHDGDGQRMLGSVLKSFSLYDTKIGYCQGLAFLVGPLLMHMPEKSAFCVLVRLMERYDLRTCFLPDLSGLHVRIYQFRELLRHNFPALSAHLEELQVETAYVSQWFLSFFAVTCPLPMLFRIYDVIFAEGASETLMRVALSLMRKNESRLLSCTELEDAMQLLLSRGLWDCYHFDADEFVQDFASLTSIVTREKLSQLEQAYRESLVATASAARASDITTAASRFLGRIWANSNAKTATLTPGLSAPSKQFSILRRSTSKQSLASTLNSLEASSASVSSTASTDGTSLSRDSANTEDENSSRESTPVGKKATKANTAEDRYLHSQIEDLLTALTELQRSNALVTNQLQREREERDEDRRAVRLLLDGLRRKAGNSEPEDAEANSSSVGYCGTNQDVHESDDEAEDSDGTVAPDDKKILTESSEHEVENSSQAEATPMSDEARKPLGHEETMSMLETPAGAPTTEDLSVLLKRVEARFAPEDKGVKHRSSMMMTKSQLREELSQAKVEANAVTAQCQDLNRRIYDMDQEVSALKEQLKERHNQVRTLHQAKQKLEKQLHSLRTTRLSASPSSETRSKEGEMEWAGVKATNSTGLREFKLGRSRSTPSTQDGTYGKRISSMPQPHEMLSESSPSEHETLLLELVQAKTAEATAKQEAEEAKQKLEALRKTIGLSPVDSPTTASAAAAAMGMFGRLTGQGTTTVTAQEATSKSGASVSVNSAAGGFWGWRR